MIPAGFFCRRVEGVALFAGEFFVDFDQF